MSDVFNNIAIPFQSTMSPIGAQTTVQSVPEQKPIQVKDVIAASKTQQPDMDSVQITKPRKKEGPIKKLKRGIAAFKKTFATIGEYAKGIGKGIVFGALAGGLTYAGGQAINAVKSFVAKHSKNATEPSLIKHHKGFGIAIAAAVLIGNIWKASLNATDARSDIHDRYLGTNKD